VTLGTGHRKIDTGNIGHKTRPMLPVSIFLCLVSNVTRVYLSVSCAQCYPCLSFCVLCPMLPVSIFLCLVSNVTCVFGQETQKDRPRVTLDTRHTKIDTGDIEHKTQKNQFYPCLSLCVLCPMFPVSIFLCLVSNVTRVYISVSRVQFYPCLSFFVLYPNWTRETEI
jgi:hypothetical protein